LLLNKAVFDDLLKKFSQFAPSKRQPDETADTTEDTEKIR
jgi:hypothetical protein